MDLNQLMQQFSAKNCSYNTDAVSTNTLPNSLMPAALADRFIDMTVNLSTLLQRVRVIRTNSCSGKIPKLDLIGPVTQGASATSCPTGVKPVERTLHYDLVKYRSYMAIETDFLECNLEGAAVQNTLLNMLQKAIANDSEYAAIQGDTSLTVGDNASDINNLLGVNDGWLKLICNCIPECNVIDAAGSAPSADMYFEAKKRIPIRFRGLESQYRFLAGHHVVDHWKYYWSSRITNMGDAALATGDVPGPWGTPFLPVPLWPEMIPYGSSGTPVSHVLLTPPQNLIYIIGRQMRMERDRNPKCDLDEIVFHWSSDFMVEDATKCVLIKNVNVCGDAYEGCETCGTADDHDACPAG